MTDAMPATPAGQNLMKNCESRCTALLVANVTRQVSSRSSLQALSAGGQSLRTRSYVRSLGQFGWNISLQFSYLRQ